MSYLVASSIIADWHRSLQVLRGMSGLDQRRAPILENLRSRIYGCQPPPSHRLRSSAGVPCPACRIRLQSSRRHWVASIFSRCYPWIYATMQCTMTMQWLRWSLTQDINIIERCWMTDCRFWMCSTLCFSWQGWWPQWIVNCDSHNQFIFLRFLRGLNFNPSSCMTWDSWQARVRKATELEAPFGFGMALFRIYCIIWNACEHTHAYISISIYLFIYIYIHLFTYIFICIHKISENQIDRFKNLLHVLTGNLEQIKQRIDQRGKEKLRRQKTYVDPLSFAYFLPSLLVSLFRFRFVIVLFLFFVFNMLHCSCF